MDRSGSGFPSAGPPSDRRDEASAYSPRGLPPIRTSGRRETAPRLHPSPTYAALDLGTNNCRLLIARQPLPEGEPGAFRVVDSFCRIVRLGEGVSASGRLSEAAMARTIAALKVCCEKMQARHVGRSRLIATEACRAAANSDEFLARVAESTGLRLEIIDRETEAFLATAGCAALADPAAESIVLFDIGGGSSEIVWLAGAPAVGARRGQFDGGLRERVRAWRSMNVGVVTLAEMFGGQVVTPESFESMVALVEKELAPFAAALADRPSCGKFHLLGTSGTVTTIAGVYLGLSRYDRRKVDGLWMSQDDITTTISALRTMPFEARAANGCIGPDRADLVLAGCAIFEAIRRAFPCERVRIADRGLREGILMQMMASDRIWSQNGC